MGYAWTNGHWSRHFTLDRQFDLKQVFSQFLIGVDKANDRTMKVLELGGKSDTQIITEMALGPVGSSDFNIDSFHKRPNFEVSYEKNSNRITWTTFNQKRILYHMPDDAITQLCKDFAVQIKLKSLRINFFKISDLASGKERQFTV